jgi:hypothetical protein
LEKEIATFRNPSGLMSDGPKGMILLGSHIWGIELNGKATKLMESPLNWNKTDIEANCHFQDAININGTIYAYEPGSTQLKCMKEGEWKWTVFNGENWSTTCSLFKHGKDLYATGNATYKLDIKSGRYETMGNIGNLGSCCIPAIYGDFIYFTANSPTSLQKKHLTTGKIDIIETNPYWGNSGARMLILDDKIYHIGRKITEIDPKTDKSQTCSKRADLTVYGACVIGNKIAMTIKAELDFHSKYGYVIQSIVGLFDPSTGDIKEITEKEDVDKPTLNHTDQHSHTLAAKSIVEWTL